MRVETKKRIADLISNILNPFLVCLAVILISSFTSASSIFDAIKWALILIFFSILPVFLVVIYLVRNDKVESFSITIREQRNKLYWLAGACAGAGCITLFYLGAPLLLLATFVAGLAEVVIFMCINLFWKISLHSAFIAGSVAFVSILYGWIAMATLVLVPLMSWSRIELKHHSVAQVTGGSILAALIVVVVFYLFGVV